MLLDSRSNDKRCSREIPIDLVSVTLLIGYFLHFALQSLPAHFRGDDLANMNDYWSAWSAGPLKIIFANLERPLPALYYLPLHAFFDLDPKPYRIATIALVAAAIPLAYALGRSLSASRSVAFLAVLAWCYHPQLANLVFVDAFIYDVLCSLFYFAALVCYIGVREQGRSFHPLQLFGFFALYVCALGSKEMAVTLPVIILFYELLKYYLESQGRSFFQWLWHNASPALVAGLIAGIYCYWKIYGPYGVYRLGYPAYIPHYSWAAFTMSNASFISQFFFLFPNHIITGGVLLAAWALVFVYAFLRRDRMLQLMAFWIVITPLPLAFVPIRNGACLIIILFGWAMIFAKLVSDLSLLIARLPLLRKVAVFRVRVGVMLLVAILLGVYTERQNPRFSLPLLHVGEKEAHIIEAFRALTLHPKPHSKILLTGNPFAHALYRQVRIPLFIAKLLWNDHSLQVYLEGQNTLNAEEVAKMDYILAVHEYKVDVIREPH